MRTARAKGKPAPPSYTPQQKALIAQEALVDHRAVEPVVLDMREVTPITDYFLICHGTSSVHIQGLAEAVREAFQERGLRPFGAEGEKEGRWVLLDYGDVVVHVFSEEDRAFYDLERLWSDAPPVTASGIAQGDHGRGTEPS